MKSTNRLTQLYISIFQVVTTSTLKLLCNNFTTTVHNPPKIESDKRYLFISNHISYFDVYAIFVGMSIKNIVRSSPMKFMTAERIYFSLFRPLLMSGGAYPAKNHRDTKYNSVQLSINYLSQGYNITMFPEGSILRGERKPPRLGAKRIIDGYEGEITLILVKLVWKPEGFWKKLHISYGECSNDISIESMIDRLYELP